MTAGGINNIVITGASSGLGEALAKSFSTHESMLGLIGRNNERLERVAGDCRSQGARVDTAAIDVCNRDELTGWLEEFDNRHPIDLIIANAGIISTADPVTHTETEEVINEIITTNYFGVINTVFPILDRMRSRGSGNVAIISSLSAYIGIPYFPAYSASKAAIKSYFEAIRGVYARDRVWISVVCPSFISTPMNAGQNNPYTHMPVDKAARIIKAGLEKHRAIITFPKYHLFGLRLLQLLPVRLADRLILKIFNL